MSSDIKTVISILCKHLMLSVDVTLKPEHFRLAKFEKNADVSFTESLWKTLCILSSHVVQDQNHETFDLKYENYLGAKLNFAYLQYPVINFYNLKRSDCSSTRELLLALAWLLAKHNPLDSVTRRKVTHSIISCEFSPVDKFQAIRNPNEELCLDSIRAQINHIISLHHKATNNIKEIWELMSEKIELMSKVHAASIDASSLPHLSVLESALVKRYALKKDQRNPEEQDDLQLLKEFNEIAGVIEIHNKWMKNQHIFFDWMETVIEEYNKQNSGVTKDSEDFKELSKFVSVLREIIKKQLYNNDLDKNSYETECVSRLLRDPDNPGGTETESWLVESTAELNLFAKEIQSQKNLLVSQLKSILGLIPNCLQI